MKFIPTPIPGAFVVETEPAADNRGYFARTFCTAEFQRAGLSMQVQQTSVSYNEQPGTLRGMHWQAAPHAEAKLVSCVRGAIWDAIVDLRRGPAFLKWFGLELTQSNGRSLFIPEGCAHGFITLAPQSVVHYQINRAYEPTASRGLRYDDPAFAIAWPATPAVIAQKDLNWLRADPATLA